MATDLGEGKIIISPEDTQHEYAPNTKQGYETCDDDDDDYRVRVITDALWCLNKHWNYKISQPCW